MKLPIQRTQQNKEQLGSSMADEVFPMARNFIERVFPEDIIRPWLGWERSLYRELGSWMPRVDVSESKNEYEITADIPGVRPEDIKVEASGQNIIIKGKRDEEKEIKEEKNKTWQRLERFWGSFYREFELPQAADMEKVEAMAQNGMLMIKVQKKPEAQSKTIEVKSSGGWQQGQQGAGEVGGQ